MVKNEGILVDSESDDDDDELEDRPTQKAPSRSLFGVEAKQAEEEKAQLIKAMKDSQDKENALQSALNNAKDDADRQRIQAQLQEQQKKTAAARQAVAGGGGGGTPKAHVSKCAPGDPLCAD